MSRIVCNVVAIANKRGITSARQLSKATGIPLSACNRLFHKDTENFSRTTLERLCLGLETTPGELLTLAPDEGRNPRT
jgi:DNA-binding Xre family transcriptional regulator